jgi:hypothetical protein
LGGFPHETTTLAGNDGSLGRAAAPADPDLDSSADRYYGGNLAGLRLIKQRYDPGDVFRHPSRSRFPARQANPHDA